jgi:hypothetical protein
MCIVEVNMKNEELRIRGGGEFIRKGEYMIGNDWKRGL